jgi:hypothetical protein
VRAEEGRESDGRGWDGVELSHAVCLPACLPAWAIQRPHRITQPPPHPTLTDLTTHYPHTPLSSTTQAPPSCPRRKTLTPSSS